MGQTIDTMIARWTNEIAECSWTWVSLKAKKCSQNNRCVVISEKEKINTNQKLYDARWSWNDILHIYVFTRKIQDYNRK